VRTRGRVAWTAGAGAVLLGLALGGLALPAPSYGQTGPRRPTETTAPVATPPGGAPTAAATVLATAAATATATGTPAATATATAPAATATATAPAATGGVVRPEPDFAIAGGWFFTQTGGGGGRGYAVTDAGGVGFWTEFQRLGGVDVVGYPASQRFEWDGFTVQVFQRVIFQWRPDLRQAYFVNVFDRLHDLGKDDFLLSARQTPRPRPFADAGKSWDAVVAGHLAVLEPFPALRAAYFGAPGDAVQSNGLPVSDAVDMGNHWAVRCQRVVLQLWKEDVPWARAGQVTVALGGDISKETGVLPDPAALQPVMPAS
jgi:hypothetical protein